MLFAELLLGVGIILILFSYAKPKYIYSRLNLHTGMAFCLLSAVIKWCEIEDDAAQHGRDIAIMRIIAYALFFSAGIGFILYRKSQGKNN